MAVMQVADKVLVHQVHPAKIGADAMASVVSNALLWRGRTKAALAVRAVLPVAGSVAVLTLADLDALAQTAPGRYVLAHMPPSAQAVRLAGDALMGLGARRRSVALLLVGATAVAAGWSHAAWPRTTARALRTAPENATCPARCGKRRSYADPVQGCPMTHCLVLAMQVVNPSASVCVGLMAVTIPPASASAWE